MWRSLYPDGRKPETELQQYARLQSEAEGEMLKECTNVVVGLTRIIRASVVTAEEDPYRWSGDVVTEFINHVGGIDRTNISFKFRTDTGRDGLVHLRIPPNRKPTAGLVNTPKSISRAPEGVRAALYRRRNILEATIPSAPMTTGLPIAFTSQGWDWTWSCMTCGWFNRA